MKKTLLFFHVTFFEKNLKKLVIVVMKVVCTLFTSHLIECNFKMSFRQFLPCHCKLWSVCRLVL